MEWIYDDGGRSQYFKANAGDCVTRAVAIATGKDYKEVYNTIRRLIGYSPRNGVYKKDTKKVMEYFGGKWKACMGKGTGCQVHLTDSELPYGTIICNLSRHVVCVIDGVIHDNHNPSRNDGRCVYGYWVFREEVNKPISISFGELLRINR